MAAPKTRTTRTAAPAQPTVETEDGGALLSAVELAELRAGREVARQRPLPETSPWDKLYGSMMDYRDHIRGCPGETPGVTKVEVYGQAIPSTAPQQPWGGPGETCTVVRCMECAGYTLLRGEPQDNIDRALAVAAGDVPAEDDNTGAGESLDAQL